nr:transcriptional regulator [uncultured Fluviicola sp.]
MNYITHIEKINDLFVEDERLSPWHISLYYALFHLWNHAKFPEYVSISRYEMMKASKIGSVNTYLKCLKELEAFGYLKYNPSRNPQKGSLVCLFIFDTTSEPAKNNGNTRSDNSNEPRERPYINNTKQDKQSETKKGKNESLRFFPPKIEEIENFFLEQESIKAEAQKFFNYFESNGWLVGGKTKMKNWKAAARNWIINSRKWQASETPQSGNLHTNQDKDYSIPL